MTNIGASLFALDNADDEAFAEELESGETTTMTFELKADEGATVNTPLACLRAKSFQNIEIFEQGEEDLSLRMELANELVTIVAQAINEN